MSKFRLLFLLPLLLFLNQCSTESFNVGGNQRPDAVSDFVLEQQIVPASNVKSIQFYKKGNAQSAPTIKLNSNEQLELRFDALTETSEQYRIEFTHHDRDWVQSILPIEFYIQGLQSFFITGGTRNLLNRPRYFSYKAQFPNQDFKFLVSGNYMMHVYDNVTNDEILSLPFFVHEGTGQISSSIETLFNRGNFGRPLDQLFSVYRYPDFVEFPQFNLKFGFAQNQFWGKTIEPQNFATVGLDQIEFHLGRNQSFPADFEFNQVDINEFEIDALRIIDFDLTTDPPYVILREDAQNFASDTIRTERNRFGSIQTSRRAQYADVTFSFEPRRNYSPGKEMYLIGDFNQWHIQPEFRLRYDSASTWWKTTALLKQGSYAYKYVFFEDGRINYMSTDDGFMRQSQEYTSFVYYQDPNRQFDRLLQVQTFFSR